LTALVVDKTGTLTEGRPVVTDVLPFDDASRDEILRIAAAVEQGATHPLAAAIVAAARGAGVAIPAVHNFSAVPGRGARGRLDEPDVEARVGSLDYVAEAGAVVPRDLASSMTLAGQDARRSCARHSRDRHHRARRFDPSDDEGGDRPPAQRRNRSDEC
jgi:cation transport ATPase